LSRATVADAIFVADPAEDLFQDLVSNGLDGDLDVAGFVLHDVTSLFGGIFTVANAKP
jgi:hypothetical protein